MIVGVTKRISSSHQLWRVDWSDEQNKKVFGKCANLHGHEWEIRVEAEGEVDQETGMVLNFILITDIIMELDHHHLNEFLTLPTAENLTKYLLDKLEALQKFSAVKVRVYETPNCYTEAEWRTS